MNFRFWFRHFGWIYYIICEHIHVHTYVYKLKPKLFRILSGICWSQFRNSVRARRRNRHRFHISFMPALHTSIWLLLLLLVYFLCDSSLLALKNAKTKKMATTKIPKKIYKKNNEIRSTWPWLSCNIVLTCNGKYDAIATDKVAWLFATVDDILVCMCTYLYIHLNVSVRFHSIL